MSKKSFVEFADVFFVSDEESLDLGNTSPVTGNTISILNEDSSESNLDTLENWSLRDRRLQLSHLETTIKHLRSEILAEYDIFGLTIESLGKALTILELTTEWIPICSDDLNCVNFAVYLLESSAYVQGIIGTNIYDELLIEKANHNQERADLWKRLQIEKEHITLLLKTESEHTLDQKEHILELISKLDESCENSLSIFKGNEKLCDLLKKLKLENLDFLNRLKDF